MKRLLGAAAAAAFAVSAFGGTALAIHLEPGDAADLRDLVPEGKAVICHYPGHVNPNPIQNKPWFDVDFYIDGDGSGCVDSGGLILVVSENGARNGHKAVAG